jgi:hypothetical protein
MPKNDKDTEAHILVIEEQGESWDICHLKKCPTERGGAMFDDIEGETLYYTCRVQACIDANGLYDIDGWDELPPGRYDIISYYEYYPGEFGGSYGEEHEIGLLLISPHPFIPAIGVNAEQQDYCRICGSRHEVSPAGGVEGSVG